MEVGIESLEVSIFIELGLGVREEPLGFGLQDNLGRAHSRFVTEEAIPVHSF